MRKPMKIGLSVAGTLVVIAGAVIAIGTTLPIGHRASREALIPAPRESVFAVIENADRYPEWRTGVERIERRTAADGAGYYVEHGPDGEIPYEIVERRPPERLVTRIAGEDLPFGGTWTFALAEAPGGTIVTITEDGEVYDPFFRFMSRYVFGHASGIERYLADLRSATPAGTTPRQ